MEVCVNVLYFHCDDIGAGVAAMARLGHADPPVYLFFSLTIGRGVVNERPLFDFHGL